MKRIIGLILAACLAAACEGRASPLALDRAKSPEEELADRQDERSRRMNISIIRKNSGGDVTEEMTPDAFAVALALHCTHALVPYDSANLNDIPVGSQFTPGPCSPSYSLQTSCHQELCNVKRFDCMAHKALALAEAVAPTDMDWWNGFDDDRPYGLNDVVIPPQSRTEANVALTLLARAMASRAVAVSAENLRRVAGLPSTYSHLCEENDPTYRQTLAQYWATVSEPRADRDDWEAANQTFLEFLSMSLIADTALAEEASEMMVRLQTAVADAQFSNSTHPMVASKLSWTDTLLSRAAAAHNLLGGELDGELYSFWQEGICPVAPLDEEGKKALSVLRQAQGPASIMDPTVAIESILVGTSGGLEESVRSRLAERLNNPELLVMDVEKLATHFEVRPDAFRRAREYLRHEIRAFGRDVAFEAPGTFLGADEEGHSVLTTTSNIVAIARPPTTPPNHYYNAITRYPKPWYHSAQLDDRDTSLCGSAAPCGIPTSTCDSVLDSCVPDADLPTIPTNGYANRGLAQTLDLAASVAHDLLNPSLVGVSGRIPTNVAEQLAGFASSMQVQRTGRLETCYKFDPNAEEPDVFRLRVMGARHPEELRIVRGMSGLRCATDGSIESARCNLEDWIVSTPGGTHTKIHESERHVGFSEYVELTVQMDLESAPTDWLFVVKRRNGAVHGPGAYEQHGYLRAQRMVPTAYLGEPSMDWRYREEQYAHCTLQPIVPIIEDQVARLIAPSRDNCTRPAENCAGLPQDIRIPLENELSDDGDSIESSWRHYMALAQSAAQEADLLGEQLIDFGFEIDNRIELAEEDLEGVCGGTVNLRDAAWGNITGVCSAGDPSRACEKGYDCVNDQCVLSLAKIGENLTEEQFSQASCVSVDNVAPLVTLGSDPVCVWKVGNEVCGKLPFKVAHDCPFPATKLGEGKWTCSVSKVKTPAKGEPISPAFEPEMVSEHLGIFKNPPGEDELNPPAGETFACSKLRELRAAGASGGASSASVVDEILKSPFFSEGRVQNFAQRIGWTAYPDDYSAITLDGNTKWETGYPLVSASNIVNGEPTFANWPCFGPSARIKAEQPADTTCGRMNEEHSLFEAFTCSCESEPGQEDNYNRALMNHRMARAVLALKTIAGVNLQHFIAPYVPDIHALVWAINEGASACRDSEDGNGCDFKKFYWDFEEANASPLVGQRTLEEAQQVVYWVEETEGKDSEKLFRNIPGKAYCWPGEYDPNELEEPLWTHIMYTRSVGSLLLRGSCGDKKQKGRNWDVFNRIPPTFHDYGKSGLVTFNTVNARALWKGFDGRTNAKPGALPSGSVPPGPLVTDAIKNPKGLDTIVLQPRNEVSSYWKVRYGGYDLAGVAGNANKWEVSMPGIQRGNLEIYNRTKIAATGLSKSDILDALELYCEVSNDESASCLVGEPLNPTTFQDLGAARKQLECAANETNRKASLIVLRDLPRELLSSALTPVSYEGERGEQVAKLYGALNDLSEFPRLIAAETRDFADDIEKLRLAVQGINISRRLAEVERKSKMSTHLASCLAGAAGAQSGWMDGPGAVLKGVTGNAAAVIGCADSVAQIAFSMQTLNLTNEKLDIEQGLTWLDFQKRFRDHRATLLSHATKLETATHEIGGALAGIEAARRRAHRHLSRGLFQASDAEGRQYATNTVMRARYNTTRARYERALASAKKLAFLSRRALEQRLGMNLEDITQDMTLVEKPSAWVNDVCQLHGIDYQQISGGQIASGDFSSAYIGDYVKKLSAVFESYSFDYPFKQGSDTAVISLRDDVVLSRSYCAQPVNNLLANSADLDAASWTYTGCRVLERDGEICEDEGVDDDNDGIIDGTEDPVGDFEWCLADPLEVRDCVRVRRLSELRATEEVRSDLPLPTHFQAGAGVDGYRVLFGGPWPGSSSFIPRAGDAEDFTRVYQQLRLKPGVYRLSWRGRIPQIPGVEGEDPARAIHVTALSKTDDTPEEEDPLPTTEEVPISPVTRLDGFGWRMFYAFFEIQGAERDVRVEIWPAHDRYFNGAFDLAALMLENVSSETSFDNAVTNPREHIPPGYVATTEAGIAQLPVCEDTDGSSFRMRWNRGCTKLCPAGFATCQNGATKCYWERSFSITNEDVESQAKLSRSGFAYGNYNFRVDSIALNFTGTATRDCSQSNFPSTCYSSGYIPYSLYHVDGFDVRNHRGDIYSAPIMKGSIESGRGLAADRYITNPISATDQSLLSDFTRYEFQGRPLTGKYVVRVWDADGVDFNGIEDVQVVMKYRYWNRLER